MIIGIPKELKNNEFRVAATPSGVHAYVVAGHTVLVEKNAGAGSAISDADYIAAGAQIIDSADEIWQKADLIQKVKEPIEIEYKRMRKGQILFTYLHLAANKLCTQAIIDSGITAIAYEEPIEIEYKRMRKGQILFTYLHLAANKLCTQAIIDSGITAIAYETVEVDGQLPLLAPMSEVAGRMSIQVGAAALEASRGGRGVLLGGVPGVRPGKVVVIGAGVVGVAAATIAHGMRADVTVMDLDLKRLAQIDQIFAGNVKTLASSEYEIEKEVTQADLVIGAVLVHGAKAPKLVSNDLVKKMKPGSVLVDVAIDQGGCFTDSKATTHEEPTFKVS